jgi:micrococcal nuclease
MSGTGAAVMAATTRLGQTTRGCDDFDGRISAQSVFDEDPDGHTGLDPDLDGLACEGRPLGVAPALWTDAVPPVAVPVALLEVIDGDTIAVSVNGRRELVRLVGIDAHEAGGPYQPVECFGPEASRFLDDLLGDGGQLFIERDVEDADRYGRLLRWVWLATDDGEVFLVNEAVVRAGFAERFRDTPNRRYVNEVIAAEAFARRYGLGLWHACASVPDRMPAASSPSPATMPAQATGCDPAYPEVCIPPPPPDLSCQDIPYTRFRVLPPDPHHFDGNQDGVACEGPG